MSRIRLYWGYPCKVCRPDDLRSGPFGVWGVPWDDLLPLYMRWLGLLDMCPLHDPQTYKSVHDSIRWAYFDKTHDPPYDVLSVMPFKLTPFQELILELVPSEVSDEART